MKIQNLFLLSSLVFFAACSPSTQKEVEPSALASLTCPDDGPRLAGTGLCVGRAVNYMNIADGTAPPIPENCNWVVNEAPAAAGQYLLYLAARCDAEMTETKPATLEFNVGAKFASVNLVWSALSNAPASSRLALVGSVARDPHINIMSHVMSDMAEANQDLGSCHVVNERELYFAKDALVVKLSDEDMARLPKDEPNQVCGRYGLDEDNAYFWRVFQGHSWFFTLDQDQYKDIDPRSLTLIEPTQNKNGDVGWQTIEAQFFK